MKIICKNIYSNLITTNLKLLKLLEKKYTFKIPNAFYASKNSRFRWDGSKKFFSPKGRFGTGLLPLIEKDLKSVGASYIVEKTEDPLLTNTEPLKGITLRDYQKEALDIVVKKRRGLIKAPTGSGKTAIIAAILNYFKGNMGVVFFTKKQILHQTYEALQALGVECGIVCGDSFDVQPLTLCTIQSVDKILDTHVKHAKVLIYDEVHEFSKGKLALASLKSFPNASVRVGFSATLPSEDTSRHSLLSFLGEVLVDIEALELVEQGYLARPDIKVIKAELPNEFDPSTNVTYNEIYEECIVENDNRNRQIADVVEAVDKGRILILTKNLAHAHILKEMIPNSYQIEGKDSMSHRKKNIESFLSDGDKSVLIGTIILQTGVDIPAITHMVNARGMKSEIATIQAIGRALRKHKSKGDALIYDFFDDVIYLSKHSEERIKHYKSNKFKLEYYEI